MNPWKYIKFTDICSLYFQNLIISLLNPSDFQLDFHWNSYLIQKSNLKRKSKYLWNLFLMQR